MCKENTFEPPIIKGKIRSSLFWAEDLISRSYANQCQRRDNLHFNFEVVESMLRATVKSTGPVC